jgi:serine/threonine protein kinase
LQYEDHDGAVANLPGPHWDIYRAAMTILRLMFPKEPYSDSWNEHDRTDNGRLERQTEAGINNIYIHEEYNEDLKNLVKQCLLYNYTKRPTLEDLLERTKVSRVSWTGTLEIQLFCISS